MPRIRRASAGKRIRGIRDRRSRWRAPRAVSAYDGMGRLLSTVDLLGNASYFTYDHNGRLTRSVDPLGNQTNSFFTDDGRLIFTRDAAGGESSRFDAHRPCTCAEGHAHVQRNRAHELKATSSSVGQATYLPC